MLDCNNCIYLNMTEQEQKDTTKSHICLKYNMRVYHRATTKVHDAFLYPCEKCQKEDNKYYVERTNKYD